MQAQRLHSSSESSVTRKLAGVRRFVRPKVAVLVLIFLVLVVVAVVHTAEGGFPLTTRRSAPRTLIIIHGQYRTLDYTVDSIVWNLVEANLPCDVVLSTPSELQLTYDTELKLRPYLVKAVYTHGSRLRNNQPALAPLLAMGKFSSEAFAAMDLSPYEFVGLVRSDVYVARPLNFTRAYGYDPAAWRAFNADSSLAKRKRDWFFSAGMGHFRGRTTDITHMWQSPQTPASFNTELVQSLDDDSLGIFETAQRNKLTYLVGTDWVYFGRTRDVLEQMRDLAANAIVAGAPLDAYLRDSHKSHGRALVNLINPTDYAVSNMPDLWFGGYAALTRSPALVAFVLHKAEVFPPPLASRKTISAASAAALQEPSTEYSQIQSAMDRFHAAVTK